ncbi:heavy metal translocating P-type ATPase [Crateriforma conspicua]|uniref:Putative copper-importing P-type ATPase A n=1 Tax=Crateriforma conspicua TaxID=2527996 RepID=A0A5C5Y7I6_9PLAN|nr:heavy metal translocating P-type ATPase [Crateriforma conspicua]TWT70743.1 putative copper-importing P-type ATPase A [Crateriforma conspicua]
MSTIVSQSGDATEAADSNASVNRQCIHCGLATRRPADANGNVFCCHGCQGAYELIQSWGLDQYYELRDVNGDAPWEPESVDFSDLDDPRLMGRSAPLVVDSDDQVPLLKCKLAVDGLHCAACVWLLERAPERVPGWVRSGVNYHQQTIEIVFDPSQQKLSSIAERVAKLGYQLSLLSDADDDRNLRESHGQLIDLAVAGFCAANAMWVAIALYAGSFTGIADSHQQILRFAGVGLGVVAVVFPGRVFFQSAWASLRTRTPHMDLPVAVGLAAGLLASLHGLFDSQRDVYFDSIACLVFFLLAGRWLQSRQQRRAGDEVAGLIRMSPVAVNRIDPDGVAQRVPLSEVMVGDRVRVDAGESVPVDGQVVQGTSTLDRSLLTGESVPVPVDEGDHVEAGTENVQGALTIQATAVGGDTRLAAITDAVADAAAARTPIVQLANRIGGWFVIIVLMLAMITGVYWVMHDSTQAVSNVVALLIVACPCALALATPLAVAVAVGRLAKQKVLVRAGDCLERLAKPGTIFFDKTGTLTEGRMKVTHWYGSDRDWNAVRAIQRHVHHPIAAAVQRGRPGAIETDESIDGFIAHVNHRPGLGVTARDGSHDYMIGNRRLVQFPNGHSLQGFVDEIESSGSTPIFVARDGDIVAVMGIADQIRQESPAVLAKLQRLGWQVGILSGDDAATVARVASTLGIANEKALGGLLPEDKLAAVESAKQNSPVVMVGDGLNDAVALAAADVGVALRGGASASLTAAPVMIGDGSLLGVVRLMDGSQKTRHSIRRNFAVSIGYNLLAVALSMAGLVTPLLAALLMPLSSLSVIAMTLSQRKSDETNNEVCPQ